MDSRGNGVSRKLETLFTVAMTLRFRKSIARPNVEISRGQKRLLSDAAEVTMSIRDRHGRLHLKLEKDFGNEAVA